MKNNKEKYVLGNILRGWVEGEFSSDEGAWNALAKQFDSLFPSENGRRVYMYKEVPVKSDCTIGNKSMNKTGNLS
ncbi:MAG: hypothetical protein WA061_02560 [Microgenomates group bacterium]